MAQHLPDHQTVTILAQATRIKNAVVHGQLIFILVILQTQTITFSLGDTFKLKAILEDDVCGRVIQM